MNEPTRSKAGVTTIAIIALAISLVAVIKTPSGQQAENTLAKVQQSGTIEACTVVNPPFSIKDAATGERSGFMIDVMNSIATKMKTEVNWHETTWGNATAELQSGRCDVVAAELFAIIPRASAAAFTKPPFFYIDTGVAARSDDHRFDNVQDIHELDRPDVTVAVSTGEAGDIWVSENFKQAKVTRIDVEAADISRFILEVTAGRADVAIAGADLIDLYVNNNPDTTRRVLQDHPFGLSPIGWAVRHGDLVWQDFLETALQYMESQGELRELGDQYGIEVLRQVKEYE